MLPGQRVVVVVVVVAFVAVIPLLISEMRRVPLLRASLLRRTLLRPPCVSWRPRSRLRRRRHRRYQAPGSSAGTCTLFAAATVGMTRTAARGCSGSCGGDTVRMISGGGDAGVSEEARLPFIAITRV